MLYIFIFIYKNKITKYMNIENTSYHNILADNKLNIEYTTMSKSGQKFDKDYLNNVLVANKLEENKENSNKLYTIDDEII